MMNWMMSVWKMMKLKMIREVENDERNNKSMMKKRKYARKYKNKLISLKIWKKYIKRCT